MMKRPPTVARPLWHTLALALPLGSALLCQHGIAEAAARKKVTAPPAEAPRAEAPANNTLTLGYLHEPREPAPSRPYFDPLPADEGVQGARLGIRDDNTTGSFTRQHFELIEAEVPITEDPANALKGLLARGTRFVLVDLPAERILQLADLPEAREILLLDVANRDDRLRGRDCRKNLVYLQPSHAMRGDALAQYLSKKRWNKWLLIQGASDADRRQADALRRSAKKFGLDIVAEKTWNPEFNDRRTPESEVPVFTQEGNYDVIVVVDELDAFGDLFPYRTWLPRPIAGGAGLRPLAWHQAHEAWGALQLQTRFREQAGRFMTERDYGGWLAVRAIGEAATRARSVEFATVSGFLLGPEFSLAGFKGVPLSFRAWDHQLRQPVLVASDRAIVAVAPVEGYLHPKNELDTLGFDEPESTCRR
ncbi:ABC transporter substrate-binding protein [Methyloparacoccus murrellii]